MASRRANPVWIGSFVLGAAAIAVAAALLLGSGRFFQKSTNWVIYFDSSVMGLEIGAPVVFRGVVVGSIVDIHAYVDPTAMVFETPVNIELGRSTVRSAHGNDFDDSEAVISSWVRKEGLRAQLKPQSLITGKLYVELGFHPDSELNLKGLDPRLQEIPSVPTQMEQIEKSVRDAMDRISSLPVEEIADNLNDVLSRIAARLDDPHLTSAIENLDGTLAEARSLVTKIDGSYGQLDKDLLATLEQLRETLAEIDAVAGNAREMVAPGSPLQYQLLMTLEELGGAARSLRVLSESLAEDPNQLIFGRQPSGDKP